MEQLKLIRISDRDSFGEIRSALHSWQQSTGCTCMAFQLAHGDIFTIITFANSVSYFFFIFKYLVMFCEATNLHHPCKFQRPLAEKATKALYDLYGTKYQVGTGADLMCKIHLCDVALFAFLLHCVFNDLR